MERNGREVSRGLMKERKNLLIGKRGVYTTSVWPDLAKFRHFGNFFKEFGNFKKLYFLLGNLLSLLWQIFPLLGNFHCWKWPKMKHNIAIWSHWLPRSFACILPVKYFTSPKIILEIWFISKMFFLRCDRKRTSLAWFWHF